MNFIDIIITERRTRKLLAQFDRAAGPEDMGACWLWKGSTSIGGYGRVDNLYAHRVMWVYASGLPIPDGLQVCHKCDVRDCVRPSHLFLGTHQDNMDDMKAKGRSTTNPHMQAKTECAQGHPYDAANTRITKAGKRACRACGREACRQWAMRHGPRDRPDRRRRH